MKTLLILITLIGLSSSVLSQFGQSWISFWDGKGHYSDRTEDLATDSIGNSYVLGTSVGAYTDNDIILIKYSPFGQKVWEYRWDSPTNVNDQGRYIKINKWGEIIVTGLTYDYYSNFNNDIVILKFDATGNLLWESVYAGINDHENISDLELDAAGNIYISGDSEEGPSGNRDYIALKYDSAGTLLWDAFYNGTLNSSDYATGIAISSIGDVYLVGNSRESGGSTIDFTTVKFNSNGVQQWVNNFNGADNNWDHGKGVLVDVFDNVYATGYSKGGGSNNTTTIRYNPLTGANIWVDVQTTSSSDSGIEMVFSTADSTLVVGGYQSGNSGDFSTIKLDTSGNFVWRTNYSSGNIRDYFVAMCLDSFGNIYVGGRSSIPSNFSEYDAILVKYDINGTEEWIYSYDGGYNELGSYPSMLDNNNVAIGITSNMIGFDENIRVIGLDNAGNEIWTQLHEGDGYANDIGSKLILDYDYNQIIIGSTNGFQATDLEDYAVVKMDTLGNQLWEYIYKHSEGGKDIAVAAVADSMNNIYVTGYTENVTGGGDFDITTIKLTPLGDTLWSRTYAASAGGDDTPCAIHIDLQGNVIVAGSGVESTTFDFLLVKYDPNGNLIGNYNFDHPTYGLSDFAYDLDIDSSNNYYITGSTQIAPGSNVDFYILKVDAAGTVIWNETKGYSGGNSDIADNVIVTDSGFIYVSGGAVLLKFDGNGNELWENNDPTVGDIVDLAIDPNENVLLTANKGQSFGTDIVTYRVTNTGVQSWMHTYNHSAGSIDTPYGIASAPNGDAYVVGNQEHQYSTNFQAVLLRFDSLGNLLSNNIYESLANWEDKFTDVSVLQSNRVLVAGQAYEEDITNLPSITWRFNLFAASYGDTSAVLKIMEVNSVTNEITIKNFGQGSIDISNHKLITDNNQLNNVSALTLLQGSLVIQPMGEVTLGGFSLDINGEGLALYEPGPNFSNPMDMIDFVQWKTSGSSLESIAVAQGKWSSGTLVNGDAPYIFVGSGSEFGNIYWNGFLGLINMQSTAQCNSNCDASALISATGAYPPYSFQWDANAGNQTTASVINLCPEIYTVLITDLKGNSTSVDVTINALLNLNFNSVITLESCQGLDGEISLSPSGGALPYIYNWDNGGTDSLETNLQNGSYEVTVTDNNLCEWDTTLIVTQDLGPVIDSLFADSITCYSLCNGSASVSATGNGILSYLWSDASSSQAINSLCEGNYSVTITDAAGCSVIDSVYVSRPDTISITIIATDDTGLCNGTAAATIAGGTLPYTIEWNDPLSQTIDSISNLCFGPYSITVEDNNGCIVAEETIVGDATDVKENQTMNFIIYPNPVRSELNISSTSRNYKKWTITDVTGRIILSDQNLLISNFNVEVNELVNGVYFFNLIYEANIISKSFVKQ